MPMRLGRAVGVWGDQMQERPKQDRGGHQRQPRHSALQPVLDYEIRLPYLHRHGHR